MPREAKEYQAFSSRMDKATFERLEGFCKESGQSKTVAIERAINMYINDYEKKIEVLKKSGK